MSKQKILIIEDERALQEVLSYNLEREGFEVALASDGQDGLRRLRSFEPDLVLLDLMLPVIDGLEVCRQLRADTKTQGIRVIMLTARSEEVDEIVGFNMGADDYVTKPFKVKPLIHRIKALLRRTGTDRQNRDVISIHGIEIDRVNHTAKARGQLLDLTPTEFRLLWALSRSAGRPFGRNELMDHCRGEDANALERTIDVHVRSLRQKLRDLGDVIETVRGVGYRFRAENEPTPAVTESNEPAE
ncbi:response regulator [Schlesneria sp. DSM 10557]|uniref:response regulator n=1 Tax=Schlesneria sp. DSM 10557 TaxID=3044399 RepID=UPI00359F270F